MSQRIYKKKIKGIKMIRFKYEKVKEEVQFYESSTIWLLYVLG